MELCSVLSSNELTSTFISNDLVELPFIEKNEVFPGASKNVELKKETTGPYYVSSSTSLKKGEVLFVEKVYASVLCEDESKYCQYCLKSLIAGVPCKGCIKHMYCTKICRNLAWNEFHQWECYGDQVDYFQGLEEMVLAFRIILKWCQNETMPPSFERLWFDSNHAIYLLCFVRSQENVERLVKDAMGFVNYLNWNTSFFQYLKTKPYFINKSEIDSITTIGALLIRHVSKMQYKALTIETYTIPNRKCTGLVACSAVSQMSHSCDPNTIYYFHNDVVIVKALIDIEANTRLTFAHRGITYYRCALNERKKKLWNLYGLDCTCLPCSDSLMHLEKIDSYICMGCRGPAIIKSSTSKELYECLKCDKSSFTMPQEIKSKMTVFNRFLTIYEQSKLRREYGGEVSLSTLDETEKLLNDINFAKEALEAGKAFLQPHHDSFRKLYEVMENIYFNNGDAEEAFLMLELSLELAEKRFGSCTVDGTLSQIHYSTKVLRYLENHKKELSSKAFKIALDKAKITLEKANEFSSLFCPVLLTTIRALRLKHLTMELAINVQDV